MNRILKRLYEIKDKPCMYLGEKKITNLTFYIIGYRDREYEVNTDFDLFWKELQDYIRAKFNENSSVSMFKTILNNTQNEEKAFDKFYELLEELVIKKNIK